MKHLLLCAIAAGITMSGCSPTTEHSETTQPVLVATDFRATGMVANSLPDVIEALNNKEVSSEALVTLYLAIHFSSQS
jgi:amidase